MNDLPIALSVCFGGITLAALWLFYRVLNRSGLAGVRSKALPVTLGLLAWLFLQGILALNDVYNTQLDRLPPRLVVFGILPAVLVILALFASARGRAFIDALPVQELTLIHVIRVPIELVLYYLAACKAIPELMTFAGRNFDVITGITAPLMAYFGFYKRKWGTGVLLGWNIMGIGLLANVVTYGILSLPTPFQQFAFDQPNWAVLNFPVVWLPTFLVPLVLFCHLASIRQLSKPAR